MAVASLVLGIVSILIGWVPVCNVVAFVPALVGLILGIIALVKDSKPVEVTEGAEAPKPKKGLSIAGIVLSGLAIVFIILWNVVFVKGVAEIGKAVETELGASLEELAEMDEDEVNEALTDYFNQLSEELENAETIVE